MWYGDPAGEQRCENAAWAAGFVQFLAHGHRVGAVAATAADGFREGGAEQAGVARLVVQVAR